MENLTLYIIAGCNGAGKTTASYSVLPEVLNCREFVNADEIAQGLSPFNPEDVAIEAGKLMLQRINYLIAQKKTFSIETTLATRSYRSLIIKAKEAGYRIELLFFWLPSPEMAIKRVAQRVLAGGHNIPTEVIVRRYWMGIQNLFNIFVPIVDSWSLYDNSDRIKAIVEKGVVFDKRKTFRHRTIMSEQEEIALFERIRKNIEEAQRKMLIKKAKLGESVVVADEHGQPRVIPAEEALRRFEVKSI